MLVGQSCQQWGDTHANTQMMRLVIGIDGGQDHDGDKGAVRNLQQRRLQSVEAEALDD